MLGNFPLCAFKREFFARHHRYTDAEKGAGAIAKAMRAKGYNISHEGVAGVLTDLLRFETEAHAGEPIDDIREVSNYVDAMMYGLERLQELPLSLRLIREMHGRLLQSARGGTKDPGEFRRSQNWTGGSRPGNALFVPPPVTELKDCLAALEAFMNEGQSQLPPLIKAGLLHL